MSNYTRLIHLLSLYATTILLTCTSNKYSDFPNATIIVGKVTILRNGVSAPLVQNIRLHPGDTIITEQNSKLKLELSDSAFWYLGYASKLVVENAIPIGDHKRRMNAHLLYGDLYIVKRTIGSEEHVISTDNLRFRITSADIGINSKVLNDSTEVLLLNGFTAFATGGNDETIIPVCSRLITRKDGSSELLPISGTNILHLKNWVGSSIVEDAHSLSGCTLPADIPLVSDVVNKQDTTAPEWKKLPGEMAEFNEMIIDTVVAVDQEGGKVFYSLINSPSGMQIDSVAGILVYKAIKTGLCTLSLSARDAVGNRCTTRVMLTVTSGLTLRLSAPSTVAPGVPFTVVAIVGKQFKSYSPHYRFDLDGDGVFEIPENGKYTKNGFVKKYKTATEGVVRMKAEVRISTGQTAYTSRAVTVNAPPEAILAVDPIVAVTGEPVQFDISQSSDTRNGTVPLSVRYDMNGDGKWDIPTKGNGLTVPVVSYAFKDPGIFTIYAQVMDKDGASDTAVAKITINALLGEGTLSAPDTTNINDSVLFTYKNNDPSISIGEYRWECSGILQGELRTTVPSASFFFNKAGSATVICRVTAGGNQQAAVSRKIVIENSATTVDAGGPYKTGVNVETVYSGTALDADSRITGYSWDMNGDGVPEAASPTTPEFKYSFRKAGNYTIRFSVVTADGEKFYDTAFVEVGNRLPTSNAGEDIVSYKDKKITISGTGTDPDGIITLYEWDFEGDGAYDFTSSEHGTVSHVFKNYAFPVLRVTDGDGAIATDTLRVIICPKGMQTIEEGKYCIDQFEFPNQQGSMPQTDVSYTEAQSICQNRGKRLCTGEEWENACTARQKGTVYPYGREYQADKCNTLDNPRVKNSLATSGEFTECKNGSEIYDMSGNAAEWTAEIAGNAYVYGGSWQNGKNESNCKSRVALQKTKKYFYAGFRCCK